MPWRLRFCLPTRNLVLRLRIEVVGVMALVQLLGRVAGYAIDHASASHRGPRQNRVGPALHVLVVLHRQELDRAVLPALAPAAIPGESRNVGAGHSENRSVGTEGVR